MGDTGIQGDTGITGDTGISGVAGDTGIQGDTGSGDQGDTGITGDTGTQGDTGSGTTGDTGITGDTGTQGDTGVGDTGASWTEVSNETPTGDIDGNNTEFTLANTPNPATSLILIRGRVIMIQDIDYTLTTNTITYTIAPPTGTIHRSWYRY